MRRALLLILLVPAALPSRAQSTGPAIEARLLDKPLYLRGAWLDDKLRFDSAGQLLGRSRTTSFTLAAIDISRVDLQSNKLLLEGRRVGIQFDKDVPTRVPLNAGKPQEPKDERIRIEIAAPPTHDFTAALDAVFTTSPGDMLPTLPDFWQTYVRKHFPPTAPSAQPPATPDHTDPHIYRVGGGITPPRLVHMPEPEFDEAARSLKVSGNSMVNMIVSTDGTTSRFAIVRPAGIGLDEKAIEAVRAYRFQPAMRNGQPVAVELNVDVNFQIF